LNPWPAHHEVGRSHGCTDLRLTRPGAYVAAPKHGELSTERYRLLSSSQRGSCNVDDTLSGTRPSSCVSSGEPAGMCIATFPSIVVVTHTLSPEGHWRTSENRSARRRNDAELLHEAELVHAHPVFDDPPVADTHDVHELQRDRSAGRRKLTERAGVRAP
jgi:hypothetical protein